MTVGSGRISKIVMSQTKNVGMMMQYLPGVIQTGKSGAMGGGYKTSRAFTSQFGQMTGPPRAFAPYQLYGGDAVSTAEAALASQLAGNFGASRTGMQSAVGQYSRQATSAGGQMLGWGAQEKRRGEIISRSVGTGGAGARAVGGNLPIKVSVEVKGVGLTEKLRNAIEAAQNQLETIIKNTINEELSGGTAAPKGGHNTGP